MRVMIDIAIQTEKDPSADKIPLMQIADRQRISKKYLESILVMLTRDGLLEGSRGKGGGYRLTKPVSAYTAGEIIRSAEGSLAPVACVEPGGEVDKCGYCEICTAHKLWSGLDKAIYDYLDSVKLSDLLS